MTCAKRIVRCYLIADYGAQVIGENLCNNPQKVCPREPGEGYQKCISVCQQHGHAEVQALSHARRVGLDLEGGTALIDGHDHACDSCTAKLRAAGITTIEIGVPHLDA